MSINAQALQLLVAKDEIRELVQLYSRGVDRKDIELLKTLYTKDATDDHGSHFSGTAEAYIEFLARSLPHIHVGGHFICNHLISMIDAVHAEGEVYALAYHFIPDGKGGSVRDVAGVRYLDNYRKEGGRWLFARRVVSFDFRDIKPVPNPADPAAPPTDDPSYKVLVSRLFARGLRA
jgi:ketosteroid isomerase-like protein